MGGLDEWLPPAAFYATGTETGLSIAQAKKKPIIWIQMPAFVNSFFEERVERLFDLAITLEKAFSAAAIEYRVVGGLAVYLYVEQAEPDAGRRARDIDLVVRRQDLQRIADAVKPFGLEYRHAAGLDMLVEREVPSGRRAVHLIFEGEKVKPEYEEPVPYFSEAQRLHGIQLTPLPHLIRMKLTSFRLKDQTHLKDMDEAGLITREIERELTPAMRERLRAVRNVE